MISTNILQAVEILKRGGLVAFPTETVYGLGADAQNETALAKIFQAKKRPLHHPLIVHIASLQELNDWAATVSPKALLLAKTYWPGPLTIVCKKQSHVLDILTGGQDTIGLRIPHHPIATQLLKTFGSGIAAPSANEFTHISPTTAEDVLDELDQRVDLILDGGECAVGLESTIIDMSQDQPQLLRPGMISTAEIEKLLGEPVLKKTNQTRAPGMHFLHYAPLTPTELKDREEISYTIKTLKQNDLPIACLFYSDLTLPENEKIHCVGMPKDPKDYAHAIYHQLRLLDQLHFKRILIEKVPSGVEWEAIWDRLTKASAVRETK